MKVIEGLFRVCSMALLALAIGAECVQGQGGSWERVEVAGIEWKFQEIEPGSGTCSIKLDKKNSGKVTIPAKVRASNGREFRVVEVAREAFHLCEDLTQIVIPEGVTTIAGRAFFKCTALEGLTLPASIQHIDGQAFMGCSAMEYFEAEEGNATYMSVDGVLFSKNGKTLVRFPEGREGDYVIPREVNSISECAFFGCSYLESVDIPMGVTAIENYTFFRAGLTSIAIPQGVTRIGDYVFQGCTGLETVSLPEGLQTIGTNAFADCSELKEVKIPASVTSIGDFTFRNCKKLASMRLPQGVTLVCAGLFSGCEKLARVDLPDGLLAIGHHAFEGCKGLKAIALPLSVTKIDEAAFTRCFDLRQVTIPASVAHVGMIAFSSSGLRAVHWLAGADCRVDGAAFQKISGDAKLYVLQGEAAKVKQSATGWWKAFGEIVEGCVVTFDSDGGSLLPALVAEPNKSLDEPAETPMKDGCNFLGWYFNGEIYDFESPITTDITLVARWKEKETYTVTFDAAGGEPAPTTQTIADGEKAAEPANKPEKSGFTFEGWYLNGEKYNFATPVTANITLVARWEEGTSSESNPPSPPTPSTPPTAVASELLERAQLVTNPIDHALVIEGLDAVERVEVYSLQGMRIHAQPLRGEHRVEMASESWPSGVYVVRVVAKGGERTLRVVKR